jgi:serine/threonine protein kinase
LDEYQIEEDRSLLGVGGYAEVRRAKHRKTGQLVAIKIYEKYKLIDVQVKHNLVREIKVLSKLNHPNILRLYESIDTFSNVYLITEYVEGVPLNEYVKKSPEKMTETEAI